MSLMENITYNRVREVADNIEMSSKKIMRILEDITSEMNRLNKDTTWQSDAAENLHNKYMALASKYDAFYELLQKYVMFLRNTVNEYEKMDTNIGGKIEEDLF